MDHIGIDAHKMESQLCILSENGQLSEPRLRTTPERFAAVLGDRPRARILLEASTESEWVARRLEGLDHEVIVADPNFAPMYAARSRKIKTDRRNARALAEACRLETYRPAHGGAIGAGGGALVGTTAATAPASTGVELQPHVTAAASCI
jgi:transposase